MFQERLHGRINLDNDVVGIACRHGAAMKWEWFVVWLGVLFLFCGKV